MVSNSLNTSALCERIRKIFRAFLAFDTGSATTVSCHGSLDDTYYGKFVDLLQHIFHSNADGFKKPHSVDCGLVEFLNQYIDKHTSFEVDDVDIALASLVVRLFSTSIAVQCEEIFNHDVLDKVKAILCRYKLYDDPRILVALFQSATSILRYGFIHCFDFIRTLGIFDRAIAAIEQSNSYFVSKCAKAFIASAVKQQCLNVEEIGVSEAEWKALFFSSTFEKALPFVEIFHSLLKQHVFESDQTSLALKHFVCKCIPSPSQLQTPNARHNLSDVWQFYSFYVQILLCQREIDSQLSDISTIQQVFPGSSNNIDDCLSCVKVCVILECCTESYVELRSKCLEWLLQNVDLCFNCQKLAECFIYCVSKIVPALSPTESHVVLNITKCFLTQTTANSIDRNRYVIQQLEVRCLSTIDTLLELGKFDSESNDDLIMLFLQLKERILYANEYRVEMVAGRVLKTWINKASVNILETKTMNILEIVQTLLEDKQWELQDLACELLQTTVKTSAVNMLSSVLLAQIVGSLAKQLESPEPYLRTSALDTVLALLKKSGWKIILSAFETEDVFWNRVFDCMKDHNDAPRSAAARIFSYAVTNDNIDFCAPKWTSYLQQFFACARLSDDPVLIQSVLATLIYIFDNVISMRLCTESFQAQADWICDSGIAEFLDAWLENYSHGPSLYDEALVKRFICVLKKALELVKENEFPFISKETVAKLSTISSCCVVVSKEVLEDRLRYSLLDDMLLALGHEKVDLDCY